MVYFKASTTKKDMRKVDDTTNKDSSKTTTSPDADTDTPRKNAHPPESSQTASFHDERQKQEETNDPIDKLQKEAIKTYLLGKGELIINHLNEKEKVPDYYVYKIPKLFFHQEGLDYIASLNGLPKHQHEFELILQRVTYLLYETKRVKYDYNQQVAKMIASVIQIMTKRIRPSETWEYYTNYFLQVLKDKQQQYIEHFDSYMTSKSKLLTDRAITSTNFDSRPDLIKHIEHYEKSNSFTGELEKIKHEALAEFIKEQIFLPRQQFEQKPSKESIKVLNEFIEQKKKELNTEAIYKGVGVEQFKLISKLLQAITLYYHCFQLQLPLFESAPELLDKIHQNTVVTIATSTGSGKKKSSLIVCM